MSKTVQMTRHSKICVQENMYKAVVIRKSTILKLNKYIEIIIK